MCHVIAGIRGHGGDVSPDPPAACSLPSAGRVDSRGYQDRSRGQGGRSAAAQDEARGCDLVQFAGRVTVDADLVDGEAARDGREPSSDDGREP
jgi:hypothetical protein